MSSTPKVRMKFVLLGLLILSGFAATAIGSDPREERALRVAVGSIKPEILQGVVTQEGCPDQSDPREAQERKLNEEANECLSALDLKKASLPTDVYLALRARFAANLPQSPIEASARRQQLLEDSVSPVVRRFPVPPGARLAWRNPGSPGAGQPGDPCLANPQRGGAYDTKTRDVNICRFSGNSISVVRHELIHAWQNSSAPDRSERLRGFATLSLPGSQEVVFEKILEWTPSPDLLKLADSVDQHFGGDTAKMHDWRLGALASYCSETQAYVMEHLELARLALYGRDTGLSSECQSQLAGFPGSVSNLIADLIQKKEYAKAEELYRKAPNGLPSIYQLYSRHWSALKRATVDFSPEMCRYSRAQLGFHPLFAGEVQRIKSGRF